MGIWGKDQFEETFHKNNFVEGLGPRPIRCCTLLVKPTHSKAVQACPEEMGTSDFPLFPLCCSMTAQVLYPLSPDPAHTRDSPRERKLPLYIKQSYADPASANCDQNGSQIKVQRVTQGPFYAVL